MKLYGAIDLHSNNAVSGLIDGDDIVKLRKRSPCDLGEILNTFEPFKNDITGIAVGNRPFQTVIFIWLNHFMLSGHRLMVSATERWHEYDNGSKSETHKN